MSVMESVRSLQISRPTLISDPHGARPGAVPQGGAVLVVLDVNKLIDPGALYWALGNVVRKGDFLKIVGLLTHMANPMGFMTRVDQGSWTTPNNLELEDELAHKKKAIQAIPYVKDWCEKQGVRLEIDVKAANQLKLVAVDEAKAIGAYHVILDKNMKKDRKHFVDNLSCFVSRARNSGGVDTIRSFAVTNKLPPMVPNPANKVPTIPPNSKTSFGSTHSHRGSSMSSTTFELGGDSSDDFNTQESDPISTPSTGESIDPEPHVARMLSPVITNVELVGLPKRNNLSNLLLRAPAAKFEPEAAGYNNINNNNKSAVANAVQKPAVRKWLSEEQQADMIYYEQGNITPRGSRAGADHHHRHHHHHHLGTAGWSGQWNATQELTQNPNPILALTQNPNPILARPKLNAALRQSSFQSRKQFRPDKIHMDVYWPIMEWADRRGVKLRHPLSSNTLSGVNAMTKVLGMRRRTGGTFLNYSDMVDTD